MVSQVEVKHLNLQFHHVHCYVDSLDDVEQYKQAEERLTKLVSRLGEVNDDDAVERGRKAWAGIVDKPKKAAEFEAQGQDLAHQMIAGLGWRVTGKYEGPETCSVLMSSKDPQGVKFVITSKVRNGKSVAEMNRGTEQFHHFQASALDRFYGNQAGRQGFAVLAFVTGAGGVQTVYDSYSSKHPKLLVHPQGPHQYEGYRMVEVFAYYKGDEADRGTIIRFLECTAEDGGHILPGMEMVAASYDKWAVPAYSDHWVSNVIDRERFLNTLNDTLGFTPKVDFNAGVVAAGAAQIESTVTGSNPVGDELYMTDKHEALKNQQQIYLPTNNDLGRVGHVHLYLEEIGQGVQHIANRVGDLVSFIARVNKLREMTGEGFTFLNIPRSYYGRLEVKALAKMETELQAPHTEKIYEALVASGVVDKVGIVKFDVTDDEIVAAKTRLDANTAQLFDKHVAHIISKTKMGRVTNLVSLLGDTLPMDTLLRIVKNKILVDIQGQDILYQIFTCNIMLRKTGQEAPFLEFIERVCSTCADANGKPRAIKPGCGGFGIRNFLTLFLSIEVSKAMLEVEKAIEANEERAVNKGQRKVKIFTDQLEQSNPILTTISDAMTEEGECLDRLKVATTTEQRNIIHKRIEEVRAIKEGGHESLKKLSAACHEAMNQLDREFA